MGSARVVTKGDILVGILSIAAPVLFLVWILGGFEEVSLTGMVIGLWGIFLFAIVPSIAITAAFFGILYGLHRLSGRRMMVPRFFGDYEEQKKRGYEP